MSNEKLTRDNLKAYSGQTVQVTLDGKNAIAELYADNPAKIFLTIAPTLTFPDTQFADVPQFVLSDKDIATLSPNGPNNLFSKIDLKSPPPASN